MVGTAGFEPATSASRTLRAAKLRHVPPRPHLIGLREAAFRSWHTSYIIGAGVSAVSGIVPGDEDRSSMDNRCPSHQGEKADLWVRAWELGTFRV